MDGYAPCTQGNCAQHKCTPVTEQVLLLLLTQAKSERRICMFLKGPFLINVKNKKMELYVHTENKFSTLTLNYIQI
jgi:hypothetical protein